MLLYCGCCGRYIGDIKVEPTDTSAVLQTCPFCGSRWLVYTWASTGTNCEQLVVVGT